MRYFFNEAGDLTDDLNGVDLPDDEAAKHHALHHARDILHDHHTGHTLCERVAMVVTDETGNTVYMISISAGHGEV